MAVSAQGGIRLIIWDFEPFVEQSAGQHVGLGLDLDLAERLSLGVQGRVSLGAGGWVVNYRTAYHFSDAESSSLYFGPVLGFRHIDSEDGTNVFPVGFRLGWRGGLERFYADLHLGGQYTLGGDQVELESTGLTDVLKTSFSAGLDLGWGWAGKSTRR